MKRSTRAALSNAREWGPEVIALTLISLIAATQPVVNAIAVAVVGAAFWYMGYRHRLLPLHGKMDRMTDTVGELVSEVRADRDDTAAPERPHLRLVRHD